MNNSRSVYNIFLVNEEDTSYVPLGQITASPKSGMANQENIDNAKQMLQNLLKECTTGVLKGSATWQNAKNDVTALATPGTAQSNKARERLADLVDDGVLELWGSSLVYNVDGLILRAPVATDGRIVYPEAKVTNSNNAQPSAPINNTPQVQGAVETKTGATVESASGAVLSDPVNKPQTPQKTEAEKRAEKVVNQIVADTNKFILSEDESHYYITDKETGQRVKYLRVTTVIGADESTTQWFPSAQEIKEKLGIESMANNVATAINTAAGMEESNDPALQKSLISDAVGLISKSTGKSTGKSKEEVQRAIAELRTEHKKTKYGPWGVPSTALGNTADIITRDFFAGELKEHYPNISDAVLFSFKSDLNAFKHDLESKGIKIVSRDVMAHGKITVTDENGNSHEVNVAGTLDLLGYDDKGNFYIFDMKTSRNLMHNKEEKLQRNKAKWSRQVSLYADLLKQSYPGFDVKPENLRIIPINVGYPAPKGNGRGLNPFGGTYSVVAKGQPNEGQLQIEKGGVKEDLIIDHPDNFTLMSCQANGQFQPGYTHFNISWSNLSSEDQDIAASLASQVDSTNEQQPVAPSNAEVLTPTRKTSALDYDLINEDANRGAIAPAPTAPPIRSVETEGMLPSWENLTDEVQSYLQESGWVADDSGYNELLDDAAMKEALLNDLKCRKLL